MLRTKKSAFPNILVRLDCEVWGHRVGACILDERFLFGQKTSLPKKVYVITSKRFTSDNIEVLFKSAKNSLLTNYPNLIFTTSKK